MKGIVFGIIALYLTLPDGLELVRRSDAGRLLSDVLRRPFRLVTGGGLFRMLLGMARADWAEPLGNPEVLFPVLLLAFPLHGRDITDCTFLAALLRDHEVAANLTQLASAAEIDEVLQFETTLQLMSSMSNQALTVLVDLLAALVLANGFNHCKYVYGCMITLINNGRSPDCFAYFIDCVEADQDNVFLKTGLLTVFKSLSQVHIHPTHREDVVWPLLQVPAPVLVSNRIGFTDVHDLPPLVVTDPEFSNCAAVATAAALVRDITVEPLGRWLAEVTAMKTAVLKQSADPTHLLDDFNGEEVARAVREALTSGSANPTRC
jgi:hypothetical protein